MLFTYSKVMQERRINIRGIIYKDGKLFAQQLKKTAGPSQFWSTPGGGLDPGESLADGLHREMMEETGIAPKIGKLLFVQQFDDGKREQLEFFFYIENADDYGTIDLTKTTHGEIEVDINDFIDPTSELILPAFLQTLDIQKYIDTDQPVFITSEL